MTEDDGMIDDATDILHFIEGPEAVVEVHRAEEHHRFFSRGLYEEEMRLLLAAAETEQWLKDVLSDPRLIIGVRTRNLDVYYRGQAVFRVRIGPFGIIADTHEKYLVDPKLASRVELQGKKFELQNLLGDGLIRTYDGKATLEKIKAAAAYYAGDEKIGCHDIAMKNPCVVDCEVAFPDFTASDGSLIKAGRLDLVTIVPHETHARLIFWEAKLYNNGSLRTGSREMNAFAPVEGQIRRYQAWIANHRAAIQETYIRVARNLVQLAEAGWVRKPTETIQKVATGEMPLVCGERAEDSVGLLIFGFDEDQRTGHKWAPHLKRLADSGIKIFAAGNPRNIRLG